MLAIPRRIKGFSHPFIKEMYIRTEMRNHKSNEILVIETIDRANDNKSYSPMAMAELLADLTHLKDKLEQKIGPIDRVDIKRPFIKHAI